MRDAATRRELGKPQERHTADAKMYTRPGTVMGRVRVNDAPPPAPAPLMAPRGPALIDDAPPQPRGRLGSIAAPPGPGWLDAPRPPSPAPAPGYDNTWTPSAYASEWQPGEPPRRAS